MRRDIKLPAVHNLLKCMPRRNEHFYAFHFIIFFHSDEIHNLVATKKIKTINSVLFFIIKKAHFRFNERIYRDGENK